jgi:glutamine phosphoribosylpyrophosphate amidotransferase
MGISLLPSSPTKPKAPVMVIKPGQAGPEIIPYDSDPLHRSFSGIEFALEGTLHYREALGLRHGIKVEPKDRPTDKHLAAVALDAYASLNSNFLAAFRDLMSYVKGAHAITVVRGGYIYAGRDWHGAGPDLFIGQNDEGLQAVSSDPKGLDECGANKITVLEPHQIARLGAQDTPDLVNWTFPKSFR